MTRARSLSLLANANIFTAEQTNNRVGIGSTIPDAKLDVDGDIVVGTAITIGKVSGIVSATDFYVDGISITGAAGTWATFTSGGEGGISTTKKVKIENGLEVTGVSTFSGNLTVGGVLSYADVTNVDSIGIITARGGLEVGASGVGGTITAAGDATFAGIVTTTEFLHVFGSAGTSEKGIEARANSTQSTDTNKAIRVRNNSNTDTFNVSYRGAATFGGDLTIPDYIVHSGDSNTKFGFESGDTFAVETGGSEALRVDSSQRLIIGSTQNVNSDALQVNTAGGSNIGVSRFSNNAGGPDLFLIKSRNTTPGSHTAVADNDVLGQIRFRGDDGTNYVEGCRLFAEVNGSVSTNTVTTDLVFGSGTTGTERLRISSGGVLLVGATASVGEGGTPADLNSTEVGRGYINIARDDTAAADHILFGKNGSIAASVGTDTSNSIVFKTGTTEAARFDSSQRLLIGGTTAVNTNAHATLQLIEADGPQFIFARNDTSTTDNQDIGLIRFYGNDSDGNYDECARIAVEAEGAHASDSKPTYMRFFTTPTSAESPSERLRIDSSGDVLPGADNSQDLGSTSLRWANIYSADLQLSNEGMVNDVDGTWGKYTIQEGENDLFLLNRRNGKKYRFMLEEV